MLAGVLVLGLLATAAACGGDDGGGGDSGAAEGSAGEGRCPAGIGGRLTIGTLAEVSTLDPAVGGMKGGSSGIENAAVFDTIMQYDTESGSYEPRMAESLESDDTFTDWTLTLREGITFGNGDPLTTEAVAFSVERQRAEGSTSSAKGLAASMGEIEIVDDRTMIFHLDQPWADFPNALGGQVGMVVNPSEVTGEINVPSVGAAAGPFTVANWTQGEELLLEANDDYWGGRPCLDEVRFVWISGAEATYQAFQNDELDVAMLREPQVIERARADGVEDHSTLANGGGMFLINNGANGTTPPTADVRVRQAIAAALDPELIDERRNAGTGMPTSAVIYETSMLYQGLEGPAYDPDRASSLVEDAMADGWDGHLRITCDNSPSSVDLALTVEGLLEAVGFDVELDNAMTTSQMVTQVSQDVNYEMSCWSLTAADESPWTELNKRINPDNYVAYDNPDMQAAFDELRVAGSPEEKMAALAEVQEIWNETVPSAIYSAAEDVAIWQDDVTGLDFTQDAIFLVERAEVGS
jgi:peptide/nickel transport system substrate-binding protein